MRIVFMGTPDFAVPTLAEIVGAGHEVVCVYSQPPRQAGRGLAMRLSAVHAFAETLRLAVETPVSLKDEAVQRAFAAHGADVAVVVAYGLLLPKAVLEAPRHGCLNLHASLLPRWRGAAPIQRAVMAGDRETGVAVMRMEAGLDTGPVCTVERVAVGADMTAGELHDALAGTGASLMVRALTALECDALDCVPQARDGVTYAAKIDKAETRIDWSRPAAEIHNHVRGLSPFPGAWFELRHGGKPARVKVLRSALAHGEGAPGEVLDAVLTVACRTGAVRLVSVQRAGKGAMSGEAFARGTAVPPGTRLA
jgi:methionyl-tRNA formyltransferase